MSPQADDPHGRLAAILSGIFVMAYQFTLQVTDQAGATDQEDFTINVT